MTNPTTSQTSQFNPLTVEEKLDMLIQQQNIIVTILGEAKFYGVNERQSRLLKIQYKKLQKNNWKLLEDRRQVKESKKESNEQSGTKEKE